ncbi:MAG: 2OG-Fe(II) oxygenase family protein [bacterium]|nr:2OG-Fe(II) oxygenase family protein [bacterium]
MDLDLTTLNTDGYVRVKRPVHLQQRVQDAMDSWQKFCALPLAEKQKLSGGDRIRDFGYMLRQDSGPHADNKELFHVLRKRITALRTKAATISDARATAFIDAIDLLLQDSTFLIRSFAHAVERRYKLPGFAAEVIVAQDNWTYRYVHYFGGDVLAHPHSDRGGFTLHLAETHDGGEYLNFEGEWHPWPVNARETIIFPSMNLQHRSAGKLKALCHRVHGRPETATEGRYSMVAFIDFFHRYRYDDRVKRLQDFEPGFNYKMPLPDFNHLFTPS